MRKSLTKEEAIIKIQKCFRHFLNGRKIRNEMKYGGNKNIWKLKSFAVMCAIDNSPFHYCKSYKDYVNNVYKSIQIWINQDSDDEEDYSLSEQQIKKIKILQKKPHIYYQDIKDLLKSLTLDQIQFIQ